MGYFDEHNVGVGSSNLNDAGRRLQKKNESSSVWSDPHARHKKIHNHPESGINPHNDVHAHGGGVCC